MSPDEEDGESVSADDDLDDTVDQNGDDDGSNEINSPSSKSSGGSKVMVNPSPLAM